MTLKNARLARIEDLPPDIKATLSKKEGLVVIESREENGKMNIQEKIQEKEQKPMTDEEIFHEAVTRFQLDDMSKGLRDIIIRASQLARQSERQKAIEDVDANPKERGLIKIEDVRKEIEEIREKNPYSITFSPVRRNCFDEALSKLLEKLEGKDVV